MLPQESIRPLSNIRLTILEVDLMNGWIHVSHRWDGEGWGWEGKGVNKIQSPKLLQWHFPLEIMSKRHLLGFLGDAHLSYQHSGYVWSQCSKFYLNLVERVKVARLCQWAQVKRSCMIILFCGPGSSPSKASIAH